MRQNEPVPVRAGGGSRQILDSCVARTSIAHPLFTFTCCLPACHSQCHEPVVPHRSGPQDGPKAEPSGAQRVVCKEEGAQPEQHILKGARGLTMRRPGCIPAGNAPCMCALHRKCCRMAQLYVLLLHWPPALTSPWDYCLPSCYKLDTRFWLDQCLGNRVPDQGSKELHAWGACTRQ